VLEYKNININDSLVLKNTNAFISLYFIEEKAKDELIGVMIKIDTKRIEFTTIEQTKINRVLWNESATAEEAKYLDTKVMRKAIKLIKF